MMQTTIKETFSLKGIGVHSGKDMQVFVHPAFANTGLQIRRYDTDNPNYVLVTPNDVINTTLATTVNLPNNVSLSTIEHLFSALYGMGIDNAYIEVSGKELPILDGSSSAYVDAILKVGIRELNAPKKYLKITSPISVEIDNKYIEIIPSRYFKITYEIGYEEQSIGTQKNYLNVTPESYMSISSARTFGLKKEAATILKSGLAKGASLDNTVIFSDDGVVNSEGLRMHNEPVLHKMLDLIGDLSLIGYPILGHIRAYKSGHAMNNILARKLIKNPDCYKILEPFAFEDDIDFAAMALKPSVLAQ